jgi:hypothetical protein
LENALVALVEDSIWLPNPRWPPLNNDFWTYFYDMDNLYDQHFSYIQHTNKLAILTGIHSQRKNLHFMDKAMRAHYLA